MIKIKIKKKKIKMKNKEIKKEKKKMNKENNKLDQILQRVRKAILKKKKVRKNNHLQLQHLFRKFKQT
jgi:hypothetical protein